VTSRESRQEQEKRVAADNAINPGYASRVGEGGSWSLTTLASPHFRDAGIDLLVRARFTTHIVCMVMQRVTEVRTNRDLQQRNYLLSSAELRAEKDT
jgi:hypothetical protein